MDLNQVRWLAADTLVEPNVPLASCPVGRLQAPLALLAECRRVSAAIHCGNRRIADRPG